MYLQAGGHWASVEGVQNREECNNNGAAIPSHDSGGKKNRVTEQT